MLQHPQSCVERRGLAGTRRPRDQDQAFAYVEQLLHPRSIDRIETERLDGAESGARIQDSDYDLLSVRRRQRRDTQVDPSTVDRNASTASLRTQSVGDVHLRHNLDARHEGHANCFGQHQNFLEHAVDPITNGDSGFAGFEMDVAGAGSDPLRHNVIDQLDHGALGLFLIEIALRVVGLFDYRLNRGFCSPVEQLADPVDWRVDLLDTLPDPPGRCQRHPNRTASGKSQHFLAVQVVRIRGRNVENRCRDRQRQDFEFAGELFGNGLPRLRAYHEIGGNPEVRAGR